MYADDTMLFKSIDLSHNVDAQMSLINENLTQLGKWCRVNKLTIYVDKSKCMSFVAPLSKFRDRDPNDIPDLYLNGTQLAYVNSYRYLGINLDKHLKMEIHLKNVIHKVRPIIYKFRKIRHLVSMSTALLMYKTYVSPNLESGLYLLDNYYKCQLEKLQKFQNKCLRLCYKKDKKIVSPTTAAKLLPLRHRRECYLLNIRNRKLIKGDGTFTMVVGNRNRA